MIKLKIKTDLKVKHQTNVYIYKWLENNIFILFKKYK